MSWQDDQPPPPRLSRSAQLESTEETLEEASWFGDHDSTTGAGAILAICQTHLPLHVLMKHVCYSLSVSDE
jgi:hypothetical protein